MSNCAPPEPKLPVFTPIPVPVFPVMPALPVLPAVSCTEPVTVTIDQCQTIEAKYPTDLLATVKFDGMDGTLIIPSGFKFDCGSLIEGFAPTDKIDYSNTNVAHFTTCLTPAVDICGIQITPAITTVNLSNASGQPVGSLRLVGDYVGKLALQTDGHGGTNVVCYCLLAGTLIMTPEGNVPVESLQAGMMVMTPEGAREITWVGFRQLDAEQHPTIRPIRIAANAFGAGLPERDLLVSPDHAIYVDGVMIPAKYLVNGSNVTIDHTVTKPHYVHVELAQHGVLYAEGLTVESYLDIGGRETFFGEFIPQMAPPQTMIHEIWEARGYAPLVITGKALNAVRAKLAQNAEILPLYLAA